MISGQITLPFNTILYSNITVILEDGIVTTEVSLTENEILDILTQKAKDNIKEQYPDCSVIKPIECNAFSIASTCYRED